jgi:hypothetical protein
MKNKTKRFTSIAILFKKNNLFCNTFLLDNCTFQLEILKGVHALSLVNEDIYGLKLIEKFCPITP